MHNVFIQLHSCSYLSVSQSDSLSIYKSINKLYQSIRKKSTAWAGQAVCLVEYENAFKRLDWKKVVTALRRIRVDWKDRRLTSAATYTRARK